MTMTTPPTTPSPRPTTRLDLDPASHVIRSSGDGIEFSPERVWQMLCRQAGRTFPYQGGLAVVVPEGMAILSREAVGYLTALFVPAHYHHYADARPGSPA